MGNSERKCDGCGFRMPPHHPRKQVDGELLCEGCLNGRPGRPMIHGQRVATPHVSERTICESCSERRAIYEVSDRYLGTSWPECQVCWDRKAPWAADDGLSARPLSTEGTRRVAHESPDNEKVLHCPFCASGKLYGRSDGTIVCELCNSFFTVSAQPEFSGTPLDPDESATGEAPEGLPEELVGEETPDQDPADLEVKEIPETVPETEPKEDVPDFLRKQQTRYFLTAQGVALPEDDYLRHLAITHADDRDTVLASIRGRG